jgi:hypothetical protein
MATVYEWDIESADAHGDIQDHHHADSLSDLAVPMSPWIAPEGGGSNALVLVRDGRDGSRHWAYVCDDGTLPDCFADAMGNPGPTVPVRFRTELAKWLGSAS